MSNTFQNTQARHLPVILLLDISGSMSDNNKIDRLNDAVNEMINCFISNKIKNKEIDVAIITFGGKANIHSELTSSDQLMSIKPFIANGMTPMGSALKLAKEMIENRDIIKPNYYIPIVILVSDGLPNDDWEKPLDDFINTGRSSKTQRMSMGIGGSDIEEPLIKFAGSREQCYFSDKADQIIEYFKFVTMSVMTRTNSVDPNKFNTVENIQKSIDEGTQGSLDDDDEDDEYWD